MEKLAALVISGAVSGAVYSLLAVGLVLTNTALRIFNFAHTAVAFAVALLYFELHSGLDWPMVPSLIVCVGVAAPLLGALIDRAVFRRIAAHDDATKIVATVGLLIAIPALALYVVETLVDTFEFDIPRGSNITLPPGLGPSPKTVWNISGSVTIDSNQVIALGVAATVALGIWFLMRRTRTGLVIRSTVDKPDLAEGRGIDTSKVSMLVTMLSFSLAGLAGVVGAPFLSLTPAAYVGLIGAVAAAAVIGGLHSIPLAFAGGVVVGLAQSLFSGYVHLLDDIPGAASSVPYVILFLGLFFLARDRSRAAGTAAEVRLPPEYLRGLPAWRRLLPWTLAVVALILWIQMTTNAYWLGLVVGGLAYAVIFLSFVIVTGIGGMVSLAQASFVLMAGLTFGWSLERGHPVALALLLGVAAAAGLGAFVALPALRLGGVALGLSTLALAFIGDGVLFEWKSLSNGDYGWTIQRPQIGPFDLGDDATFAMLQLGIIGLISLGIRNLARSPAGHAMTAVRSSQVAAASVGISVQLTKLRVFALSASIAGVGGVLLSMSNRSVTNLSFDPIVGLTWLAIVVIVGVRRPGGALIAGLAFAVSPEVFGWFTESSRVQNVLFGLGAVQLAMAPDGILAQMGGLGLRLTKLRGSNRHEERDDGLAGGSPRAAAHADRDSRLHLANVSAAYGDIEVLHDVSVSVPEGEITVLLGANGAGKSTLCAVASGLLFPTMGEVLRYGAVITRQAAYRRAADGVFVVPESRGIFPSLSVEDNLSLGLPSRDERVRAIERFPSLAERRRLPAGDLSGGEQQMLALATFAVNPPRVLIVDEPGLGLAPLIVEQIRELLVELKNAGTAVLIAEEKAQNVVGLADQVYFMDRGRVLWSRPGDEVDFERLAESYLKVDA